MFGKPPKDTEHIDAALEDAYHALSPYSEDYLTTLEGIERLTKLKDGNVRQPVSSDTLVMVAGNLLGIALIVGYERAHVVSSKSLQFLKSLR